MTTLAQSEKIKTLGNALAGVGLLFVGLNVMSGALNFQADSPAYKAISSFFGRVGCAVFADCLFACRRSGYCACSVIYGGKRNSYYYSGGNALFFIIIGFNVGTCITASISSICANTNAKRAAPIHFMFNFFGTILFMIVLLCRKGFACTLIVSAFPDNTEFKITLFNTLFNVLCASLFLPY